MFYYILVFVGESDFNVDQCLQLPNPHLRMFEVLKLMARDKTHSCLTGYGPLLPDQNVFCNDHVFRGVVVKAYGLEVQRHQFH